MTLAIETEHLTRTYSAPRPVVDDVALCVPEGCIYGFLGPNGAGKTTTIRMLLGLIRPTDGSIRVFGTSVRDEPVAMLRRVGAIVEAPAAFSHLTGRENLDIRRRLRGGIEKNAIDRTLALVGLADAGNQRVQEYSLGMRQRLDIAGALLSDPSLLILDEPTNGLDPMGIRDIRELIRHLASERKITIFLSSHLLSEVDNVATHIGLIHQGKMQFQGTRDEFRAQAAPHITIDVDDTASAIILLRPICHNMSVRASTITITDPIDSAEINERLVAAGIRVTQLRREMPSLEDVFFRLVGEEPDGESDRRAA